jgi:mRNA-degrading endonuclease RelE of RelBE toxin-antitoxin system
VISKVRPSFRRDFERLAPSVKTRARLAYQLFAENPNHPSLRFKKLQGSDRVWSIRISEQYRAVGVRSGDTIEWIWIGTHNEFDNLFS